MNNIHAHVTTTPHIEIINCPYQIIFIIVRTIIIYTSIDVMYQGLPSRTFVLIFCVLIKIVYLADHLVIYKYLLAPETLLELSRNCRETGRKLGRSHVIQYTVYHVTN